MVNGKFHAALLCHPDHIVQLFQAHGYRLLTDDILAGVGSLDHKVMMLVVFAAIRTTCTSGSLISSSFEL